MTPTGLPTLGRYALMREIARSNDIVWEGIDPQMNRRVAVKELNLSPTLTGQARRERIERFYREARAAGKLNHPNIVTIHEVGEQAGRYFIAMEFLEGQTLRDRLATVGALSQSEAVQYAAQLCDALAYAHEQGIVHRDIKPDNVHIVGGNRLKLTDFGIARITGEQQLTLAGQVFGTPSYMSPEQVIGREIDRRSDIFSLGILLYEMLSGRKPFTGEGDSVVTIAHRIMSEPTPPALGAATALNLVIQRATAKDPNQRFSSAHEMKSALHAADTRTGAFNAPAYPTAPPTLYPAPYPAAPPAAPNPTQMYGQQTQFAAQPYPAAPSLAPATGTPATQTPYPPPPTQYPNTQYPTPNTSSNAARFAAIAVLLLLVVGGIGWAGSVAFSRAFKQQQVQVRATQAAGELTTAINLYNAKQYEQAAQAFARIRQGGGGNAESAKQYESYCYVELGNIAIRNGDLAAAEAWFNEALRLNPDDLDVTKGLESVRQARAQGGQAAPVASATPPPAAQTPSASYNTNVSRADFERSNQQAAQQAEFLLSEGNDLYRAGQTNQALTKWSETTKAAPGSSAATQAQRQIQQHNLGQDPFAPLGSFGGGGG